MQEISYFSLYHEIYLIILYLLLLANLCFLCRCVKTFASVLSVYKSIFTACNILCKNEIRKPKLLIIAEYEESAYNDPECDEAHAYTDWGPCSPNCKKSEYEMGERTRQLTFKTHKAFKECMVSGILIRFSICVFQLLFMPNLILAPKESSNQTNREM